MHTLPMSIRVLLTLILGLAINLAASQIITSAAHALRRAAIAPFQAIYGVLPGALHIPSIPLTLIILGLMLLITIYFLPDDHHWP